MIQHHPTSQLVCNMDYIISYSQLVTQPNFPSKSLVLEVLVPDVVVIEVLVVLLLDVDVLVWVELEDDELVVLVSLSVVVVVRHSETGTWFTRIPPLTRHKALTSDWDQAIAAGNIRARRIQRMAQEGARKVQGVPHDIFAFANQILSFKSA